jgi:ProP effector
MPHSRRKPPADARRPSENVCVGSTDGLEATTSQGGRPILRLRFPPPIDLSRTKVVLRPTPPARPVAAPAPAPAHWLPPEQWLDLVIERVAALRQAFPGAFRAADDPGPWPPLKVGIHRDILQRAPEFAAPRKLLRRAIARYIADWRYRAGRVEGAVRVDLDGQPAGTVTASQAAADQMSPRKES